MQCLILISITITQRVPFFWNKTIKTSCYRVNMSRLSNIRRYFHHISYLNTLFQSSRYSSSASNSNKVSWSLQPPWDAPRSRVAFVFTSVVVSECANRESATTAPGPCARVRTELALLKYWSVRRAGSPTIAFGLETDVAVFDWTWPITLEGTTPAAPQVEPSSG